MTKLELLMSEFGIAPEVTNRITIVADRIGETDELIAQTLIGEIGWKVVTNMGGWTAVSRLHRIRVSLAPEIQCPLCGRSNDQIAHNRNVSVSEGSA